MPNQTQQYPGIALPGSEYFNLAPNRTVALGPRLIVTQDITTPISIAANGQGESDQTLLVAPQFQRTSGLYIVRSQVIYFPGDGSGELTITAIRLGLGPPGGTANIQLDIGLPLATLVNPTGPQLIIQEQDALVTGLDFGPTSPFVVSATMNLYSRIVVNNHDATNPHTFQARTLMIYHQLEGFVQ